MYGNYNYGGNGSIDGPQIDVKVTKFGSTGKCLYKLIGRGVDDSVVEDCAPVINDYTQINIDNYYTYFYPNYSPLGFYTDTRGTLVIIKSTGCTLRTYQRGGTVGEVSHTESVLSTAVCDKIKKKLDDQIVELEDYWAKWEVNFERKMEKLPPVYDIVDPLKNQPPMTSLYSGQPGAPMSSSSTNGNTASTPSLPSQPLAPSLPAQPLTPNLPAQPLTPTIQNGGPTILGMDKMETNNENSITTPPFNTYSNVFNNDDGCLLLECVKGNGVHDCFTMPCPQKKPTAMSFGGLLLWGHPDLHPFSIFSDTPDTLYLFEGGWCTKKTYTTRNRVTKSKAELLSSEDCVKAKKYLENSLKKRGMAMDSNGVFSFGNASPVDSSDDVNPPMTMDGTAALPTQPVSDTAITPSLPPQPLTPSLQPQPLTPSLPSQPVTPSNNGGPTVLGVDSIRCKNKNSVNNPSYNTVTNFNQNDDGCTWEKCVEGNGVNDCFKIPCPEKTPNSMSFNGMILCGHPDKDPFSFFSDEWATMYLFEGGWCTKKTYSTSDMVTTSKAELLSSEDCTMTKIKLEKALKQRGVTINPNGGFSVGGAISFNSSPSPVRPPPTPAQPAPQPLPSQPLSSTTNLNTGVQDVTSKRIELSTTFPKTSNGQCQVEISILGKGVQDKFTEPCSDKKADSVSTDDVFIFGDPKTNSFSLYSNEPNVLYVIKNKICTKKTYTTKNGVTKSIRTPLKLGKCNEIKKTISDLLARQRSTPSSSTAPSTSVQSPTPVATPAVSTIPPDLQQFKPTYPLKLGDSGKDGFYSMSAVQITDSFNVKGCNYYIKAKGKGINDHFQVPCSNEYKNNIAISSKDFMLFGTPTTTLGLFSDTPSTLIIMNKGTCFKKTYGTKPTGPTALGKKECEEVKRKMLGLLNSKGSSQASIGTSANTAETTDSLSGLGDSSNTNINLGSSSPLFAQPLFHPFTSGFPFATAGQINPVNIPNPSSLTSQPILTSDQPTSYQPTSSSTTSTSPGVTWRDGDFNSIYSSQFYVDIKKAAGGTCSIEVVGRGVNDLLQDSCSILGNNIKKVDMGYVLAVADPTKQSGFYTEDWGALVYVREGQCFKKKYDTEYGEQTKITTTEMSSSQCDKVKDSISSTMGVTFGQAPGSSSEKNPTWRPGNYNRVYNGNPTININKNNNGPNGCTMTVTIMGRALNDEITGSCSEMGTNIQKKTTSYSLAVADPSTRSGMFTEDWGSLVVITNGRCTLREYDSSPITHTTKITSSPVDKVRCDNVKRKMSGMLGANFG